MLKNVSDDPTPCCLLQQTTDSYAALILPPLPRGHVIVLTARPSSDGLLIRSPRRFLLSNFSAIFNRHFRNRLILQPSTELEYLSFIN